MIESLKFADGIMHSSKWFVVAFILLWLPAQIIAQDMTPEQVERMRQAEARQRAEEYARSRDLTAQDMIVDPQQYLIGPGDELTIFFSGAYTREYQINVTPEGSVLVPEFGAIQLGQITLGEAKEKVLAALAQRYYNLEISITLSKLRKLKVSVDGEVYFPGIYTITSLDRATEAIQMAGGLRDNASRRNISLIRNDSVHNVDLLLFARGGNQSRNPCLAEGDKIFVPPRQPLVGLVEIYGPVKMPGKYEYVEDDRIYDLVMLAGGLQIEADSNLAELVRFDPSGDSTFTMNIALKELLRNPSSEFNLILLPDDRLFIRAIPDYHRKAQVVIEGEVLFPGVYAIREDTTTLLDIIRQAGGFTPKASLDEAKMLRYGYEALKDTELDRQIKISTDQLSDFEREYLLLRSAPDQGKVSVDFRELFEKGSLAQNVTLKNGDRIIVPSISNTIRVMGRVLKPGLVSYEEGAKLNQYIDRAGGYLRTADVGRVRLIKGTTGSIIKCGSKTRIDVGDAILVPQKKDTNWWQVTKDIGIFLANLATVYIVIDNVME